MATGARLGPPQSRGFSTFNLQDHVWSETLRDDGASWAVYEGPGDAPARNFAARLDEGIGAWSGVLCIAPDPAHTCDATELYLRCEPAGRASAEVAGEMARYAATVDAARADATGGATQARALQAPRRDRDRGPATVDRPRPPKAPRDPEGPRASIVPRPVFTAVPGPGRRAASRATSCTRARGSTRRR